MKTMNVALSDGERVNHGTPQGRCRRLFYEFFSNKLACAGTAIILVLALIAIFAPKIAPQDPYKLTDSYDAGPSAQHFLGTDSLGRDIFSRLIYASRISLIVGIGTMLISTFLGTLLGLLSGFLGGKVDMVIMRTADVFMTFPPMIILLVLVGIIGPGLWKIIFVLGILGWTSLARVVRGCVLSVKEKNYIKASRLMGISTARIVTSHVLPNVAGPVFLSATSMTVYGILSEASLSFLGLGVQPPVASWGNMLTEAQSLTVLTSMPWVWVPPSVLILICVFSFNSIGDGLRDALAGERTSSTTTD